MTLPLLISLLTATIAGAGALTLVLLRKAPGLRAFSNHMVSALAATTYALCDVPMTLEGSAATLLFLQRLAVVAAAVTVATWIEHAAMLVRGSVSRRARAFAVLVVALTLPSLIPGVTYRDETTLHAVPWLGVVYRDPVLTYYGTAVYALLVAGMLVAVYAMYQARRRGAPEARGLLPGALILALGGLWDASVAATHAPLPYLLTLAYLVVTGIVSAGVARRIVEDAGRLESLRRELERVVQERTVELQSAQVALELEQELAALGRLAAGVAHEINNPAAAVLANLRFARGELRGADDDALAAIDESIDATERIAHIVRDLRDAGREAAPRPERLPGVTVAAVAERALATVRATAPRPRAIDLLVAPDLVARAQPGPLYQVLVNLLSNALYATRAHDGVVLVRAERRDDRVVVSVTDEGEGMAEDVRRRVFEPFFTTKPPGIGTGLGLSVSLGIVRSFGGELRVESKLGQGTTVAIELFAASDSGDDGASSSGMFPALRAATEAPGRVLLVDDDPLVRSATARLLGRAYELVSEVGVEAALARVDAGERYDAYLLDVMMPDGGGRRLLAELGERDPALARRVVFVTGGSVPERIVAPDGFEPPVLRKPYDVHALVRALDRASARRPGGRRLAHTEPLATGSGQEHTPKNGRDRGI